MRAMFTAFESSPVSIAHANANTRVGRFGEAQDGLVATQARGERGGHALSSLSNRMHGLMRPADMSSEGARRVPVRADETGPPAVAELEAAIQ